MAPKTKRKGRPLLVAAAGVAFVSFVQCEPKDHPVGNLRPAPEMDAAEPIPPVGNLRPSDYDTGAPAPTVIDAGAPAKDASAPKDAGLPKIGPVGNLRPPPTK